MQPFGRSRTTHPSSYCTDRCRPNHRYTSLLSIPELPIHKKEPVRLSPGKKTNPARPRAILVPSSMKIEQARSMVSDLVERSIFEVENTRLPGRVLGERSPGQASRRAKTCSEVAGEHVPRGDASRNSKIADVATPRRPPL